MSCAIEALDERLACLVALEEAAADGVKFTSGAPGFDELREVNNILLRATQETLGTYSGGLGYGQEQGCEVFRTELASFLSQQYADDVSSSNLMVTAGATQGLHLVLTVLTENTAPILVEDPTYFLSLQIFQKDLNRRVIPVSSDETGMNLEDLDKKLTSLQDSAKPKSNKDRYWAVVYVMTAFSNPCGLTYSDAKNDQLVQLARKHHVLIVTDDVYNLIWYSQSTNSDNGLAAPSRLLAFDKPSDPDYSTGHVISIGTFSKFMAPAIRLGWLEAPDKLLSNVYNSGLAHSGGSFNHYMSRLMTCALKSGLVEQHLSSVRLEYSKRMEKLCDLLLKHLPKGFMFTKPKGGFFLWLKFPMDVDTMEFAQFSAERYGIIFTPGVLFSPTEECRNCARLSISAIDETKIEVGVKELCLAFKDYRTM